MQQNPITLDEVKPHFDHWAHVTRSAISRSNTCELLQGFVLSREPVCQVHVIQFATTLCWA